MIQGAVNATLEALVPLTVQGPAGQSLDVDAVIDTGFTGFLTLSPSLVAELGLPYDGTGWALLADGTEAGFDVHSATMLWDDGPRRVYVYAADAAPLVGMQMLHRHSLYVEVENGGRVIIQARE